MRVLITDDSPTIRMILKGLLKQLQITEVMEANDGNEALDMLNNNKVDILLLDVHMPNMDGAALLAEMKKSPALEKLPVIMISSDTTPEQLQKAEALGAHAYIRKPFRKEGLREAIAAAFPEFPMPAPNKTRK